MRKGHKRTQSATLTCTPVSTDTEPQVQNQPMTTRLEIPALLSESSAKIREKVCHVESLNVSPGEYTDPLFTFGRGLRNKEALKSKKTAIGEEYLIVIPQQNDQKQKIREKKSMNCGMPVIEGILSTGSYTKQSRIPFGERTNQTAKEDPASNLPREQEQKTKGLELSHHLHLQATFRPNSLMRRISTFK